MSLQTNLCIFNMHVELTRLHLTVPPAYNAGRGASSTQLLRAESTSSATAMSNARLLVVMGDSSSLELVEEFAPGPGNGTKYFTNSVTEVQLDEGAQLNHGSAFLSNLTVQQAVAATDMISNCLSCMAAKCILCNSCKGRQQACSSTAAVLHAPAVSKVCSRCQAGGQTQAAVAVKCEL